MHQIKNNRQFGLQFGSITSWPNCNGALIIHLKTQKEDGIPLALLFPTVPVPPSSLTDPPRAVVSDPHASLTHSGWWTQARGAFLLTITRRSKWLLPHYIHQLCTLALLDIRDLFIFLRQSCSNRCRPCPPPPSQPCVVPASFDG